MKAVKEMASWDVEKVRKDFPVLSQEVNGKPLVYLDNAASSQVPQVVIERGSIKSGLDSVVLHRLNAEIIS